MPCKKKVNRFIFSSTAAVYGFSTAPAVSEEAELRPNSPYGNSKLMTDDHTPGYGGCRFPMRYVASRYFNVGRAEPKGPGGPIHTQRH